MASQSPPALAAEVKTEETAERTQPEATHGDEGNAVSPAPENSHEPTPAAASGVSKKMLEVMEGILHRLTAYKTEE